MRTISNESGASVLISSHLISEMEMLCDKVVFLTGESVIKTTNITDMDYSEQIKLILYVDNASKALSLLRDPNLYLAIKKCTKWQLNMHATCHFKLLMQ